MSQAQLIFEKQWLHASLLAVLLAAMVLVTGYEGVRTGQLWGVTTPVWLWLAVGLGHLTTRSRRTRPRRTAERDCSK